MPSGAASTHQHLCAAALILTQTQGTACLQANWCRSDRLHHHARDTHHVTAPCRPCPTAIASLRDGTAALESAAAARRAPSATVARSSQSEWQGEWRADTALRTRGSLSAGACLRCRQHHNDRLSCLCLPVLVRLAPRRKATVMVRCRWACKPSIRVSTTLNHTYHGVTCTRVVHCRGPIAGVKVDQPAHLGRGQCPQKRPR